jgi:hypothetical protein
MTFIGAAALIEKAGDAAYDACVQADEDLVARQMEAAPVKTGTLRAGIHIESIDRAGLSTTATNSTGGESNAYAGRVHFGGDEYPIEAHEGKMLFWPGADHPVKRVMHPATAPNPYMTTPLLDGIPLYEQAGAAAMAAKF